MQRESFERCMKWTECHIGVKQVRILIRILTMIYMFVYAFILLYLAYHGNAWFVRMLCVPAVAFVFTSLFRSIYSAPRPYQVYHFEPLLHKETQGKSFPSRHTFSAFIIGMAVLSVNSYVGGILLVLGSILGCLRIITGVHFPKDVVAGAAIGIILGYLGFFLI